MVTRVALSSPFLRFMVPPPSFSAATLTQGIIWGFPDKTGEVDDDRNDQDDQNDAMVPDIVKIHLVPLD